MNKPEKNEYPEFYHGYVDMVPENDLIEALRSSLNAIRSFVETIPPDKHNFSYGEGKWKLKEVLIHLADTERVMQYRALCFSRNDKTPLPGFDEKDFINNCNTDNFSFNDIVDDLVNVRIATVSLFKSCSDSMLMRKGVANKGNFTVRTLGYIIAGHQAHHINIIKERYLKEE